MVEYLKYDAFNAEKLKQLVSNNSSMWLAFKKFIKLYLSELFANFTRFGMIE